MFPFSVSVGSATMMIVLIPNVSSGFQMICHGDFVGNRISFLSYLSSVVNCSILLLLDIVI